MTTAAATLIAKAALATKTDVESSGRPVTVVRFDFGNRVAALHVMAEGLRIRMFSPQLNEKEVLQAHAFFDRLDPRGVEPYICVDFDELEESAAAR